MDLNKYLDIAVQASQKGGAILIKYWGHLTAISDKDIHGDLVTEADKESERVIIAFLKHHFPTHAILSEEVGFLKGEEADLQWVIDPLDGTTNYAHQFPSVSVSIALLFKGEPIVGVVFNPFTNELFQAAKGKGAALNGQVLKVSRISSIDHSLLCTGFPYDRKVNPDNNFAEFMHLTNLSQGVRRIGSAALDLAYVAAGRLDGYWETGIKSWDVAAGIVLVTEAGGQISSYDMSALDLDADRLHLLASNGLIHTAMSQELLLARNKL